MGKRLGVAALIRPSSDSKHVLHVLLGRRGKDPNRGLFVLPGGGVEDGESLEEALRREVREETGLELAEESSRWCCVDVIELPDRIILVALARTSAQTAPIAGGDLYDVGWYEMGLLPIDVSPVVAPILARYGFHPGEAR